MPRELFSSVDALKYLELEPWASCLIQAHLSWGVETPKNLCGVQDLLGGGC